MNPSELHDADLTSFGFLSAGFRRDPYPCYRRLRSAAPVCHFPTLRLWTVSRWNDAVEVLSDPEVFSSNGRTSFESTLNGADPPAHTRVRRALAPPFSSRSIASLEATIREIATELLANLILEGGADFMATFARPLPLRVVARMLGMELEECESLRGWVDDQVCGGVGSDAADRSGVLERSRAAEDLFLRFVSRSARRRSEGVLDPLLRRVQGRSPLEPAAAVDLAKQLVIAGSETTSNLLGNALVALLRAPEEMRLLVSSPGRAPAMIEEALRFDTPAQSLFRRTTRSVTLGGATIPPQEDVLVLLGSANRDESAFAEPDRFTILRKPNEHLAFGIGSHYCLGARLARAEARIAFEEILRRLVWIRPKGSLEAVEYIDSDRIRGPKSLWIEVGRRD